MLISNILSPKVLNYFSLIKRGNRGRKCVFRTDKSVLFFELKTELTLKKVYFPLDFLQKRAFVHPSDDVASAGFLCPSDEENQTKNIYL